MTRERGRDRLPWRCRLRGHGWRRSLVVPGSYVRDTCPRCVDLDVARPPA